jgi:lysophospholipid hydrolase
LLSFLFEDASRQTLFTPRYALTYAVQLLPLLLSSISSIKTLDEAKVMPGVLYQAMPIQSYDTLGSFGKFDEILKIGLDAATRQIAAWKAEGKLPTGVLEGHAVSGRRAKNSIRLRRNSI